MGESDQAAPSAPVVRILEAARFAAEKHAAQRRKGLAQEPYINHLLEVAELIASSNPVLDANLVIAGLLHDTIEDTGVTREELEERFGSDVAGLVAEVTDDHSLPKAARRASQLENAPRRSERAQVIKLADKISNVRSMSTSPPLNWSDQLIREYVEWARDVVNRLSSPNPKLKDEFERVYARFSKI